MAEAFLEEFVAERAPSMAFYSEDRGLVAPGDAVDVLTSALSDVSAGCVVEIKSGDWFLARRGSGVSSSRSVSLSACVDVGRMFWGFGFRGRPARRVSEVLADLIDASSVGGGTFELGSQAFAMTRIVTGQFDAVIEVGSRLVD
jgi:fructose-1,6-bisphosphatase/inositol monophosphatase family enzyme